MFSVPPPTHYFLDILTLYEVEIMDYPAKCDVTEQFLKYIREKIAFTRTPFWGKYERNKQNWIIFLVCGVCVCERERERGERRIQGIYI